MKIELPGKIWEFKEDSRGNEIGNFGEFKEKNEVYIDRLHNEHLKIYAQRQKNKWDNWVIYSGYEGDGKSTLAKQDCYIMANLCKGNFTHNQVAFEPMRFSKLLDESNIGDSVLYDEGITGMSSQRTMSNVNHILKVKSTMCRKKRLFVAICIPSLFDLAKQIAIRRTIGMCKIYAEKTIRGQFVYYNRSQKRILYIKGKKFEDMNATKGGPASRFLRWSFIDEYKYEQEKDKAQEILFKEEQPINKFKIQRDALIKMITDEAQWPYKRVCERLEELTNIPLGETGIGAAKDSFRTNFAKELAKTHPKNSIII